MMNKSKSKFKSKENEVNELRNQLARALADYDNLRKRVERENQENEKLYSLSLTLRFLAVLDILESAQKHLMDSGLAIGIAEFRKVLAEENLEEINPKKGEVFDPNLEEAVETVPGGKEGTVSEVLLSGWRVRQGVIIRVAKVKVFAKK